MQGLDIPHRLPGGAWGPPAALSSAVARLRYLRRAWMGGGVEGLSDLSSRWRERGPNPHLVVRCARHYERAAAMVVSGAVGTASQFVDPPPLSWFRARDAFGDDGSAGALPVGARAVTHAALRVDLAGGWTDTPPISYEAGGCILNAAVTLSGERPLEVWCERVERPVVELVCLGRDGEVSCSVTCTSLEDFR